VSTAVAAAKDGIESNAGDHHRQQNEDDTLQRHSELLLPAYAPSDKALIRAFALLDLSDLH
jgi:hypothetical protein